MAESVVFCLLGVSAIPSSPVSEEQAHRAEELYQTLRAAADQDLRALAELLASKPDDQLFGATEFQARDIVHRIGARALQAAATRRKKGGM